MDEIPPDGRLRGTKVLDPTEAMARPGAAMMFAGVAAALELGLRGAGSPLWAGSALWRRNDEVVGRV